MREKDGGSSLTNDELQFCAEDEEVVIIPNLSIGSLQLINGDFGPFRAQSASTVPLWLGILLKKRQLCRIKPPEWMNPSSLADVLAGEKGDASSWQELPFHYVEIAKLLFTEAEDDFQEFDIDIHEVRRLIDDIRIIRFDKMEKHFKNIKDASTIRITNFCAMELNLMRPFLLGTLDQYQKLNKFDGDDSVTLTEDQNQDQAAAAEERPAVRQLRRNQ